MATAMGACQAVYSMKALGANNAKLQLTHSPMGHVWQLELNLNCFQDSHLLFL